MSVTPVAIPFGGSATLGTRIGGASPPHHPLYCIVCDMRSPWSADLASAAERLGVRVERTTGDITDFWFNDLSRRWKAAPVAIGGLTAHGPLFCLERFGWDHGLRVVFRGTHRFRAGGRVEHAISGPSRTVAAVQHATLAGAGWTREVARLLSSCAPAPDASSAIVRGSLPPGDAGAEPDDVLVSWVIAPKHAPVGDGHQHQREA